jgi:hypothetical protein
MQCLGDDQPEHAVAEEFQPLVGGMGGGAGVSQGPLEQSLVREEVAQPRLQISR